MSVDQAEGISRVIEKYPYCSSLYILELVGLANSNDINFESKLKLAASHVSDREHLFNLINQGAEVADNKETNVKEKPIEVEEIEEIEVRESKTSTVEPTAEKEKEIADIDPTIEAEVAELDEAILSHAIEVAFEHASDELIEVNIDEEQEKITKEEEVISTAEKKVEVESKDMSFIQWLQYKKENISSTETTEETSSKPKKEVDSTKMSKKEINALLDKFIEEEPSISAPTKAFFDPSKNAKKSLEESVDIVSETLAKIHLMQGNYSKAIAAYKQLILLYPEKKAFFANQIEKIKQKQP
jgi:tetratricopeptide (TPR) repeat protein